MTQTQTSKKLLPYFQIDGQFGGNQSWFLDPWMHLGGCGALTMCDLCIYLSLYGGLPQCGPEDPGSLTRKTYRKFGMQMKPYLRPRESGIKDLATFIEGALIYLEDSEVTGITMQPLDGHKPYAAAEAALRDRLDHDLPVPMLLLKHQSREFNFFEWHWFLLIGYEQREDGFYVRAATYGKEHWLHLPRLWDTGQPERGGLVLVQRADT